MQFLRKERLIRCDTPAIRQKKIWGMWYTALLQHLVWRDGFYDDESRNVLKLTRASLLRDYPNYEPNMGNLSHQPTVHRFMIWERAATTRNKRRWRMDLTACRQRQRPSNYASWSDSRMSFRTTMLPKGASKLELQAYKLAQALLKRAICES